MKDHDSYDRQIREQTDVPGDCSTRSRTSAEGLSPVGDKVQYWCPHYGGQRFSAKSLRKMACLGSIPALIFGLNILSINTLGGYPITIGKCSKKIKIMIDGRWGLWEALVTHGNNNNKNMRTKTLLLAAAFTAAGIAAIQAQSNVYSLNVVGYYNIVVPGGGAANSPLRFKLSTLQLRNAGIASPTLNNTLTNLPAGMQVHLWNQVSGGFGGAVEFLGPGDGWESDGSIPYGAGFFLKNPTDSSMTVTVVGEVMQGDLVNTWSTLFNPRGSQVPQAGLITTDLGYNTVGAQIYSWNNPNPSWHGPNEYLGTGDGWELGERTLAVGEAVMTRSSGAKQWNRNFTVQ